jgi:nicotinamidase-related amidase
MSMGRLLAFLMPHRRSWQMQHFVLETIAYSRCVDKPQLNNRTTPVILLGRGSERGVYPMTNMRNALVGAVIVAFLSSVSGVRAGDVIEDWGNVKAPAPPEVKPVTIDPKTTALLLLDFHPPNCTNRPRCIASLPKLKKLLTEARAKGVPVVYSVSGQADPSKIMPDIAPTSGEPWVRASVDKFMGTELEKILKDKGIRTVIITGTAAHGAVLYTGSGSALRGMSVVVPVDGMSSEDEFYEQATAWLLAKGTGGIGPKVTLTRIDMIKF